MRLGESGFFEKKILRKETCQDLEAEFVNEYEHLL